jgi:hypothetical protein
VASAAFADAVLPFDSHAAGSIRDFDATGVRVVDPWGAGPAAGSA